MNENPQQQRRGSPPLKPVDAKQYSFDVGLVKITAYRGKGGNRSLPSTADIHPSVGKMEERLKAVVDLKAFESILMEVLRPEVSDRTLLVPTHFHQRLVQLRIALRTGSAQMERRTAQKIDSLLKDLEEQLARGDGHNDLLEQYRLMILMG
ncbi:MAG: hypothetical protein LBH53_00600 [Puniceicoccales bacterium]|jgi:hypothetical protein|nr:hypothetical protein [Puniceicoccales bacterium]